MSERKECSNEGNATPTAIGNDYAARCLSRTSRLIFESPVRFFQF
jgi:hypothetical protein